jgi:hypothetical protein
MLQKKKRFRKAEDRSFYQEEDRKARRKLSKQVKKIKLITSTKKEVETLGQLFQQGIDY